MQSERLQTVYNRRGTGKGRPGACETSNDQNAKGAGQGNRGVSERAKPVTVKHDSGVDRKGAGA